MKPIYCLILSLMVLLTACEKQPISETSALPLVRVFSTHPSSDEILELRGSIEPAHRVRLGFKQGGLISEILVNAGQHISRGQVVGRLDQVDAKALVKSAQAAYDKAQRDFERAERLLDSGVTTVKSRDDARAQLDACEAALTQAREALSRTQLFSPVDGTVYARLAEPGETIGPGTPVLAIDGTRNLIVRAGATEKELSKLIFGQTGVLMMPDDTRMEGKITSLAKMPNPEDGLYAVEITPNSSLSPNFVPGTLLRMQFTINREEAGMIRIPLEALVHRRDQDFVFVIQSESANHVVNLTPITIAQISGKDVILRTGLSGTERIVAEGAYFLQDKQSVRILE